MFIWKIKILNAYITQCGKANAGWVLELNTKFKIEKVRISKYLSTANDGRHSRNTQNGRRRKEKDQKI